MLKFQSMLLAVICIAYCLSEVGAATSGQCKREGGICVSKDRKGCKPLPYHCGSPGKTCCEGGRMSGHIKRKINKKRKCNTRRKCSKVGGECVQLDSCEGISNDQLCKGASCTCCVTALNCTCGEINTDRIVGGEDVDPPNKYPFMVGIIDPDFPFPGYLCGGSIINELYILSAAHCFQFGDPRRMQVVVGDHDQYSNDDDISGVTEILDIDEVIIHKKSQKNDIALIRLAEPLNLEDHPEVKPVCLPSDPSNDYGGETCTAIGWGTEEYLDPNLPDILQEVDMEIVSTDECTGTTVGGVTITDKMVCALVDGGGKDACQGDSGGPLTVTEDGKQVLVGITSFGEGCAEPGIPGVYTRVSSYLKWIKKNTKDASYCP